MCLVCVCVRVSCKGERDRGRKGGTEKERGREGGRHRERDREGGGGKERNRVVDRERERGDTVLYIHSTYSSTAYVGQENLDIN